LNGSSKNLSFHSEIIYIALNYVDRILEKKKITFSKHLMLIGIACYFIAAKVEESEEPTIESIIISNLQLEEDRMEFTSNDLKVVLF
jgi:hypothetical protein